MPLAIRTIDHETWFVIDHVDSHRPFFMSVVSDVNHWLFISSNGGLTAGRKNSQQALFPYTTDDKITDAAENTGPKTIIRSGTGTGQGVWEPFSCRTEGQYPIRRNLYKNQLGNKVRFEEIHEDWGLAFTYEWSTSRRYGFVRRSTLENRSGEAVRISVLDGVQNVMPFGVDPTLQIQSSNLADAYKRSELLPEAGLGIYALSAIIVDKAEPSEALKANVVWSAGHDHPTYLLSSRQVEAFRAGATVRQETDVKGERGSYFTVSDVALDSGASQSWITVADVNQTQAQVVALRNEIRSDRNLTNRIAQDIAAGSRRLRALVAEADGLRLTADPLKDARHYSNTLFNIMRGGIFDHHYDIGKADLFDYLRKANADVAQRHAIFIEALPGTFRRDRLLAALNGTTDPDLFRLCVEYLPLKFSRRHGDPTRPWNQFSINTHHELDGSKILDYEGNWRDIFQNWEALAHAYPGFIDGMVFKFLNASTFDGYNPYRVTKGGFDWETIESDNPWSYIGYWGDHQVIYLLKLLEICHTRKPGALQAMLARDVFVYADVPYRIKPYADILQDPKNTIEFDDAADHAVRSRIASLGADGALLPDASGGIHRANLTEKLLAMLLAKLSNFVPGGGIWMNTQRPEWNDANNALVGNGVSMVTLYYVRRLLGFLPAILEEAGFESVPVTAEMATFFERVEGILVAERGLLSGSVNDADRKRVTDALGQAGSEYRSAVYGNGFREGRISIRLSHILSFVDTARDHIDHAIRANRRSDGLYHAYNILIRKSEGMGIERLDEMLEGQVAVLSAGVLDAQESLAVLDALRKSSLYREDQNSYLLYPDKDLPGFLSKNRIPDTAVASSLLLVTLLNAGDLRIVNRDADGVCHFNGNFRNANDLSDALEGLADGPYALLAVKDRERVLAIFEEVFNHKSFTGRSGTFFGYEGLGSIYWHMVSKLHLAVMETCQAAMVAGADARIVDGLVRHFREIGEGIGIHKDPKLYGAFPTDPYSHTPKHKGAQQPGMTGQVKEDILVSIGELGVELSQGRLAFRPRLLRPADFLPDSRSFDIVDLSGNMRTVDVPEGGIGFTYCQVPVVYRLTGSGIKILRSDGTTTTFPGDTLDEATTRAILERTGAVVEVRVGPEGIEPPTRRSSVYCSTN